MRLLRRNAVTVRVEVPEGSRSTVATASADIEINGPVGERDVKTSSGDISTDDVAADVDCQDGEWSHHDRQRRAARSALTRPRATCAARAWPGGALFSTTSGDLELGAAGARVEVKATSGDVRLGELAHGAKVVNVSGDVRVLALGEGTLHVRSVSGDVSVGVRQGVDLHVDVETISGSVHSDIPLGTRPGAGAPSGTRVDLSVRSVSGNVEIGRLEQVA